MTLSTRHEGGLLVFGPITISLCLAHCAWTRTFRHPKFCYPMFCRPNY